MTEHNYTEMKHTESLVSDDQRPLYGLSQVKNTRKFQYAN